MHVRSSMYVDESNAKDTSNCLLLRLGLNISWFV